MERPILFKGEMVQALFKGKNQTRRNTGQLKKIINENPDQWEYLGLDHKGEYMFFNHCYDREEFIKCPYGKPGDKLWVRETMIVDGYLDLYYAADDMALEFLPPLDYYYRSPEYTGKIPSIFMPRWASRTNILVKKIRLERLQNISEADAIAEGFKGIQDFKEYICMINGKEIWDFNAWVWVVEFERIKK